MAIPGQYNGNINLWINGAVGSLVDTNMDLQVLLKYWSSLTVQQRNALKTLMINKITSTVSELELIKTEIQGVTN
jgi:hypothetical protein